MTRSKLEKYVEILKTLSENSSLKASKVAYVVKVNFDETKRQLNFLVKNGLVECKVSNQRIVYSVTPRGLAILKHFKLLNQDIEDIETVNQISD